MSSTTNNIFAALEAYAQSCRRQKIAATVDSIDGLHISIPYSDAASTNPDRLAQHIRRLKKNAFASQMRAQAEAAMAFFAIHHL